MGKVSAKGMVITIDDSAGSPQTVSTDIDSYEIEQGAGKIDVTGFSEGTVNYIPGLPVFGVSLGCKYNSAATTGLWTVLQGILGHATSKTISIIPEAGGKAFSGEFMLDGLPVAGDPKSEIKIGSVHFSPMGSVAPTWAS
jgi:hypothetical protein